MELEPRLETNRLRRYRRPLIKWSVIAFGALLFLHLAGGWYFSGQIYSSALEPDPTTTDFDIEVIASDQLSITLSTVDGPEELAVPGTWGLAWENGYGQLTELVATGEETAQWQLDLVAGTLPRAGDLVDLDVRAFPGDPMQAHGISFTNVMFTSSLGENPSWFIEGDQATWVVLIHGNGLTRRDVLKPLPAIVEGGYPALVMTYRNHPQAPADPSGRLQYGLTEWQDVEGAVEYAITEGAEDVVLVGYSMGGGIATNFLYESPLAVRVRGLILDAPLLDLSAAIDVGAANRSLPLIGLPIPGTLTSTAKWIAGWRYDVNWEDLDYLERADELQVPILLFHGTDDDIVPAKTSDELAALRPDLVTYHRIENAQHLESWNLDPVEYERLLTEFLAGL